MDKTPPASLPMQDTPASTHSIRGSEIQCARRHTCTLSLPQGVGTKRQAGKTSGRRHVGRGAVRTRRAVEISLIICCFCFFTLFYSNLLLHNICNCCAAIYVGVLLQHQLTLRQFACYGTNKGFNFERIKQ